MMAQYYQKNKKVLQRKNSVRFQDLSKEKKIKSNNMLMNGK